MRCINCGTEIKECRFGDLAWEPDYDPGDDPVVWRHVATGYAVCGNLKTFASPKDLTGPTECVQDSAMT